MIRNTNLLLRIAAHIERHPEQHNQSVWAAVGTDVSDSTACGTAACIAGWAVLSAKPHWLSEQPEDPEDWWEFSLVDKAIRAEVPDMYFPTWEQVGAHLLGLTDYEAKILFDSSAEPVDDLTWPEALRKIAAGENVDEVIDQ